MRQILSEKNIVIVLFVLVLVIFSLAQEDSKKMERMYTGAGSAVAHQLLPDPAPQNPVSQPAGLPE